LAIAIVIGLVKEKLNLGIIFVNLGEYPFCKNLFILFHGSDINIINKF